MLHLNTEDYVHLLHGSKFLKHDNKGKQRTVIKLMGWSSFCE